MSIIISETKLLSKAKADAGQRIRQGFVDALSSGKFLSTTLNIEVDNRRNGIDNDLQNLEGLIFKNEYPFQWKCFNSSFKTIANLTEAEALRLEMVNDGNAKYANKTIKEQAIVDLFALEGDATNPTTVSDYDAIVW